MSLRWWRFARDCVLADLREQRRWHRWELVRPFLEQRREYLALWRAYLQGTSPAPADRARLLELEQRLRLQDILLFRGLAGRTGPDQATVPSPNRPAAARAAAVPRSASMSELLAFNDDRPLANSTSETELARHRLSNDGLDMHGSEGIGERRGSWLAWLWRSSHQPAEVEAAAGSEPGPAEPVDGAGGYAPLRFTRAQLQYLHRWVYPEVEDSEPQGASSSLVDVQGRLCIGGLRVELRCAAPEADREAVPLAVVQLVELSLLSTQELTGRTKAELSVESLTVCDASGPDGLPAELLAPLVASSGPTQQALRVLQEAWPASSCTWPERGSWNPESEAGSRVSIWLAPCRVSLEPSCGQLARFFCKPASMPTAPPAASAVVKLFMHETVVALPFLGPGGSKHSLELCIASAELEEDPSGRLQQRGAHARAANQAALQAGSTPFEAVHRRLTVHDMSLRFCTGATGAVDLMPPHSFTATLSELVTDGVSRNTVHCQFAEVTILLHQTQLDHMVCLANSLGQAHDAGVFDLGTQAPAQRVGPTFLMEAWLGAELVRLQLGCEDHAVDFEAQQPRLKAKFFTGTLQMQSDLETFRVTLQHLLPGALGAQVLGHLFVRGLSVQHDSNALASSELTRVQLNYAEICVAPASEHGSSGSLEGHLLTSTSPTVTASSRSQPAAIFAMSATETNSAAVSLWFKHDPSLEDVALSVEVCTLQLHESGLVSTAIAAVNTLQAAVTQWWSSMIASAPRAPESGVPACQQPVPIALRCDGRAFVLEFPSLAPTPFMDASGVSLSMLSDSAGSVDGELQIEALSLLKSTDQLPLLLSPCWVALTCSRHGDAEGLCVKLKAGPIHAAFLYSHIALLSAAQQLLLALAPEPAPSSEGTIALPVSRVDIVLPSAEVAFATNYDERRRSTASPEQVQTRQHRIAVAVVDVHASFSARSPNEQSAACRFQSFTLRQVMEAPESAECDSSDETLLQVCGAGADQSAVLLEVEVLRSGLLAQAVVPCLRVHLSASSATAATCVVLQRVAGDLPAIEPSDVPFVLDVRLEDIDAVIEGSGTSATPSLHLRSATSLRAACSGGVTQPFRQQVSAQVPMLLVEFLRGGKMPPAVLLAPCSAVLRVRLGSHGRASLQCSDLQVHLAYTQLRALLALAESMMSMLSRSDVADDATPVLQPPLHGLLPSTPSQRPGSSASSEASGPSEYFDAQEHLEGDAELTAVQEGSVVAPVQPLETRLEIYQGTCTATFIDDCGRVATPLFQLVLSPSTCHGALSDDHLRLHAMLGISFYHYSRRHHQAGPQGWEPVLEPCTCSVDLGLGSALRSVEVASHGGVELNVLPSMLGSLSSLHHRLVADSDSTDDGRQSMLQDAFAPGTLLRNDTGVPFSFWLQAGDLPSELAPSAEVLVPDEPGGSHPGQRNCLHVLFGGFQKLDLHAPYRDRYRLWPAGLSGQSPHIVYVLVHSRSVDGVEHVTVHSPFTLLNATAEPLGVRLRMRDSDETQSMILKPGAREPVPIGFQSGWVEAELPPCETSVPDNHASVHDPAAQLELTVASLQTLRGRGGVMQLRSHHDPRCCYSLLTELPKQAPQCWLISVYAPLVLHNSLLCGLEYELSDCASSHNSEPVQASASQRGRLVRSSSLPIFCSSAWGVQGPHECYLRLRCEDFSWSKPVQLSLARESDDAVESRHELEIRCPASHGTVRAGVDQDREATAAVLRLHVVRRATGVIAEVCGGVWVQNECHLSLHYELNNDASTAAVLQPTASTTVAQNSIAAHCAAAPLQGTGYGLPDVRLRATAAEGTRRAKGAGGSSAFLSLSDLLQLGDQSEEVRIGLPLPQQVGGSAEESRWLDLGAKLVPLEHKFGRSLLLTIAPRYVLLNRTAKPLLFRQHGHAGYVELAPFATERRLVPIHWHDSQRPRYICFRRLERGEEWSGRVPFESSGVGPLAGGAELSIRLRNLETGASEFPRLSLHQLPGRPTFVLQVLDELAGSAPITVTNETKHELRFKQAGVSLVCVVPAGAAYPYAWDAPAGRQRLHLTLVGCGVRFSCSTAPSRASRPLFGGFLGRRLFELCVSSEGACTQIRVQEVATNSAPKLPMGIMAAVAPLQESVITAAKEDLPFQVLVQLPTIGITLLDSRPRELLYLSLHGLRLALQKQAGETGQRSAALAIASAQLDCQLPRRATHEEVLLRSGAATRRDAVSMEMTLSESDTLTLLHHANATLQEVTLRIDEEALHAALAAIQPALANTSSSKPAQAGSLTVFEELQQRNMLQDSGAAATRLFVRHFKLHAVNLKLSLQRADAPDWDGLPAPVDAPDHGGDMHHDAHVFGWLRWLGVTLMSLDEMPMRLPEITLQQVLLPSGGLMQELQQRYGRALWQQAYKVLPSSALLGDPYGTLRRLRKGWLQYWQELSRASWRELPVVSARGGVHLLSLALSSVLHATGTSTLALYNSLTALLVQEGHFTADVSLVEGLLCGLGGLARETARGVEWLASGGKLHRLPLVFEGPALMLLVPVGLTRGVQRLLLLLAVGSLSFTRSTVEASRTLLRGQGEVAERPGRARAPRELAPHQLLSPLSHPDGPSVLASLPERVSGRDAPLLYAVPMHAPRGMLLVTATSVIAVCTQTGAVYWVLALEDLLLVQRQDALLRLLCLSADARVAPANPVAAHATAAAATLLHHVGMVSAAHATRVHEMLGVASLNARGLACAPPNRNPLFRTILLGPGQSARPSAEPAVGGSPPSAGERAPPSTPNPPSGLFASFGERSILARSSPAHAAFPRIAEPLPLRRRLLQ